MRTNRNEYNRDYLPTKSDRLRKYPKTKRQFLVVRVLEQFFIAVLAILTGAVVVRFLA